MTRAALILALGALAGCTAVQQAADDVARGQAKTAVNGVVAQRFPGVNAAPITNCIIDSATSPEILQIAGSSATGATAEVVQQVSKITQRPETLACMSKQGLTLLKL
ncbi:succinate dehydrogenase [Aquicoccus sp. G2-2]|uniref:succinate dehydrogenase n=1 Tax=Aquicoccus sp. G2-2 TaxID=3092120 RepID=UPI002AE0AA15|nr:succinate dehydrogenase [Aquicoccus sp. G2-2]MEA1112390.1 succinate dehydrogenase [Aquicoccus sp. G2-2]